MKWQEARREALSSRLKPPLLAGYIGSPSLLDRPSNSSISTQRARLLLRVLLRRLFWRRSKREPYWVVCVCVCLPFFQLAEDLSIVLRRASARGICKMRQVMHDMHERVVS